MRCRASPSSMTSLLVALALAVGGAGCRGDEGEAPRRAYASWTAPVADSTQVPPFFPASEPEVFNTQTVRQVVRMSLGGDRWRIQLSNRFGQQPVTFSGVRVARSTGGSNIDVGSSRTVTFGGQASLTLEPGYEASSDPVELTVEALGNLAVTSYFEASTTVTTVHWDARQVAYLGAGNQLSAASIPAGPEDQRQSYFALSRVDNLSTEPARVVVAFGDSITDGNASTFDAAKRYPNQLDDRLKAAGRTRTSVVNEGYSGNRWLNDILGPSGNSRFQRDVLDVPGASHVIILLGINDIGFSTFDPSQEVSAEQIIDSMGNAMARARARGLKVLLGTLLPYEGAAYYSEAGEAKRQAVNTWIRDRSGADKVIDFDLALRDPAAPLRLRPDYDSSDHIHPNDAGYAAMAAAVDLDALQ